MYVLLSELLKLRQGFVGFYLNFLGIRQNFDFKFLSLWERNLHQTTCTLLLLVLRPCFFRVIGFSVERSIEFKVILIRVEQNQFLYRWHLQTLCQWIICWSADFSDNQHLGLVLFSYLFVYLILFRVIKLYFPSSECLPKSLLMGITKFQFFQNSKLQYTL